MGGGGAFGQGGVSAQEIKDRKVYNFPRCVSACMYRAMMNSQRNIDTFYTHTHKPDSVYVPPMRNKSLSTSRN